ncbi:MAG: hypothetical protein KJO98_13545 [Rhodothermia bacterium]|nr:hypothetical protein [Rhodothermia bacterium]
MNARLYIAADVQEVMRLHADLLRVYPGTMTVLEVLERQAAALLAGHRNGDPAVAIQIRSWLPGFAGAADHDILGASLSPDDIHLTVAREHGFSNWDEVAAHGSRTFDADFERAVDAVVGGRLPILERLVFANPKLVVDRSPYGHGATLLHYVAANGVETWRQTVPRVAPQITRYLIAAGADPNTTGNFYGGRYAPGPLVETSDHPARAGLTEAILSALEDSS